MLCNRLQCFSAELYATFEECKDVPQQCIAPTKRKTRCKWPINIADVAEATSKLHEARKSLDGQQRATLIGDFILLHCCERQHRHKLEADDTGCLDEIVMTYGKKLGISQAEPADTEPNLSLLQAQAYPASIAEVRNQTEKQDAISTQTTTRMRLRSLMMTHSTTEILRTYPRNLEVFCPYKSDPRDSIHSDLLQDVPLHWATWGEVYSFTWTLHPQFVKVGYTSRSAVERVEEWQRCHPGAMLSKKITVDYPERIERLVHLQLARGRHRIRICKTCYRSHEEWFRASADTVNQVISDWVELMQRSPLYEKNRTLTRKWRETIHRIDEEITARALLDRLDAEETLQQAGGSHHLIVSQARPPKNSPTVTSPSGGSAIGVMSRQQDLVLTYFEEFMLLLAQTDDRNGTTPRPMAEHAILQLAGSAGAKVNLPLRLKTSAGPCRKTKLNC